MPNQTYKLLIGPIVYSTDINNKKTKFLIFLFYNISLITINFYF